MPLNYTVTKSGTPPPPIPEEEYEAILLDVRERADLNFGNNPEPTIELIFQIAEGQHAGIERGLLARFKISKGKTEDRTSKLYKVLTVLIGEEPSGEGSLEDLTGTPCKIKIKTKESGWQYVAEVLPAD